MTASWTNLETPPRFSIRIIVSFMNFPIYHLIWTSTIVIEAAFQWGMRMSFMAED